jgi:hypothetical protein
MLVLGAASGRADWIRLDASVNIGIKLDIEDVPLVSDRLLSITEVLQGANDFPIESWVEVVVSILSLILPLISSVSNHELLADNTFGCLDRSEVFDDIVISAEAWDWVVDLVAKFLLLVLVLGAAC